MFVENDALALKKVKICTEVKRCNKESEKDAAKKAKKMQQRK